MLVLGGGKVGFAKLSSYCASKFGYNRFDGECS